MVDRNARGVTTFMPVNAAFCSGSLYLLQLLQMFEAVWGALYMDRGNVEAVYELYCKLCPLVL